jgi:glycosidase
MRAVNPHALLLGEVWLRSGLQFQDYLSGETFNSLFDFPAFHTLIADQDTNGDGTVSGQSSFEFPQIALNNADTLYSDKAHLVRFINNHDTNRFLSEVKGDLDRAKAGAVWLLTVPGTPMLYYGEEIGMFGSKGDGGYYDEYRREPMDWARNGKGEFVPSWFQVDESHNSANDGISVEEQDNDPSSLLNHYRALGAFRNATPALRGRFGAICLSPQGHDLYAVWRGDLDSDLVLVFINFSTQAITAKMIDDRLGSESLENWEAMFAAGFEVSGSTLTLDAAGYAVLMRTDS